MELTKNYLQIGKFRIQWVCPESEITNKHWMFEVSYNKKYIGIYEDGFHQSIWTKAEGTN
jgi:hypothetical protein